MDVIIWSRVSTNSQDNTRQILNLRQVANEKGWVVKRVFEEKVSGTIKTTDRREFTKMVEYLDQHGVKMVLISEISRIGRRVIDILNVIDFFHKRGISVYVQQFNMISLEECKENPIFMLLLQMMSIGAEMENNLRKERQREGIQIAKIQKKYAGRKIGAVANKEKFVRKYSDVADLIKKSELSVRRISTITNRSINTVRKVKSLLEA